MTLIKKHQNRGFVKTIIIIVVVLLVISYYGLNLRQIASSPTTKDNFSYAWDQVVRVWEITKNFITHSVEKAESNTQGTTTHQ